MWSAGRSVSSMTKFVCESIARHHPRVGLVEELLPRVGVPSRAQRHVIGVLDCCERRRDGDGADVLGQTASTKHGGG